jgi:hypothetical protein
MPNVNGQDFPYTKKGMAAAKRAEDSKPSGKGMMDKTPGTMTKPQMVKKQGSNVEAMKKALKRAASAAPKAGMPAKKMTLPAKMGDSGMKSNMPAKKDMPSKKKNLGM